MGKDAAPAIIEARYRIVRKARTRPAAPPQRAPSTRSQTGWARLTVLMAATNASLLVRLLMKHLLNWG